MRGTRMGCGDSRSFSERGASVGPINKKGPPFGEPFSILRMVPAPEERYVSAGARFFGRLEFAGKFGVPQLVTINKSASYGA